MNIREAFLDGTEDGNFGIVGESSYVFGHVEGCCNFAAF